MSLISCPRALNVCIHSYVEYYIIVYNSRVRFGIVPRNRWRVCLISSLCALDIPFVKIKSNNIPAESFVRNDDETKRAAERVIKKKK